MASSRRRFGAGADDVTSAGAKRAAFDHLFVRVRDVPATRRFYVEQLGLTLLSESPHGTYLRIGGGDGFYIGFEAGPGRPDEPDDGIEIRVRVADVDATWARLRQAGVPVGDPPADQVWGDRHAWLRDPTGHRVSIYSPSPARPPRA